MRNDLPYFSHDNDARNHAKMKALRARFGWTGYGQFWALNEMIAGSEGARLDLSRKVVRSACACELGLTTDALDAFISFLSDQNECGLVTTDSGIITTDRTQEDLSQVMRHRGAAREAKEARKGQKPELTATSPKLTATLLEPSSKVTLKKTQSRVEKSRIEEHSAIRASAKSIDQAETNPPDPHPVAPDCPPPPPGTMAEYPKQVHEAWAKLGPKALQPPSLLHFLNATWPRLSPIFRGIHSSDILAAIANYTRLQTAASVNGTISTLPPSPSASDRVSLAQMSFRRSVASRW